MNLRGDTNLEACNLVKDENGDLLAEFDHILDRWKNYFSQVLNVPSVSDVMQMEIQQSHCYLILALSRLKLLLQI
jgi:hypothetical protein